MKRGGVLKVVETPAELRQGKRAGKVTTGSSCFIFMGCHVCSESRVAYKGDSGVPAGCSRVQHAGVQHAGVGRRHAGVSRGCIQGCSRGRGQGCYSKGYIQEYSSGCIQGCSRSEAGGADRGATARGAYRGIAGGAARVHAWGQQGY